MKRDPLSIYRAQLCAANVFTDADAERVTAETRSAVKAAADRAAAAPWPSLSEDFMTRTFVQ